MQQSTLDKLNAVAQALSAVAMMVRQDGNEAVASNDPVQVITHFSQIRGVNATIKTAREALSEIEDQFSKEFVPDVLRSHNVKSMNIEGIGNAFLSNRFGCSMIDKDAGMQWLKDNGHGGLIQPTVNSSTLAAFAKDMIQEQGKELPEDIFKTSIATFTSIRK